MIREQIRPVLMSFLLLTIITGIIYPMIVTGISQVIFKREANGSIIYINGKAVGSNLIGQQFDDPKYFWGRPSATSPANNASASSGSNYGPMNPDYLKAVQGRVDALKSAYPANTALIPVDLVTASGSGLDPHISLAAAYYQIPRIARLRNMTEEEVKTIVDRNTQGRFLGVIGEPVVNVLRSNLALDQKKQ